MSGIFGILGLNDHEYPYLNTLGQQVIYDAVNEEMSRHQTELNNMLAAFVEEETEGYKERYKLPGGGRLQRMSGQTQAATVKATGKWDVAYPLEDFGAQVAQDRIDFSYATVRELDLHLDTVQTQNINTMRFEILKALFNNAQDTFNDEHWGNLLIEPLANGDSVVYPPVIGSESEATDDHYLESGYAAAAISDTNDPYETIYDELHEHSGEGMIVSWINKAQRAQTEALTDFVKVTAMHVTPGDDTATTSPLGVTVPGKYIGTVGDIGVYQWDWIPANYIAALDLDRPKPLKIRRHPAATNLPRALQLVSESDIYPFVQAHYENHFGVGCGNRLNGVIMELGTGGTYTVPVAYQ